MNKINHRALRDTAPSMRVPGSWSTDIPNFVAAAEHSAPSRPISVYGETKSRKRVRNHAHLHPKHLAQAKRSVKTPPVFSEFFCEVIRARSAYFEHYNARGWHILPLEEHSPMALAVDKFLSVAWFWDDMEPIIAAEGAQECDEDNEEEKERISYAQHEDPDVTDKSDALGSLVSTFDGLNVWTPEDDDNKYEDDVEPITDDEEDVVMGGM